MGTQAEQIGAEAEQIGTEGKQELSRRELMKRGLRAGAYAAPVVLASVVVAPVAAQQMVSRPTLLITQPVAFFQDFTVTGAVPSFTYNVFYRPSNSTVFTQAGTLTTDARGVGGTVFPIALNTDPNNGGATSVLIVATIPGQPSSTPTSPYFSLTSTIITVLAGANGAPRPAALLAALVIQEQTSATVGGVANFTDYVDVGIFNGTPGTAFDIYLQPNGTGTFTRVTTVTTNAQGNITAFVPVTLTGVAAASSFTVNAVLAGASSTPAVLTRTVASTSVTTIPFMALMPAGAASAYTPKANALQA